MTTEQLEQAARLWNRVCTLQLSITSLGHGGLTDIVMRFDDGTAKSITDESLILARAGIEQAFRREIAQIKHELRTEFGVSETVRAVA
jgi:hypothetical protein